MQATHVEAMNDSHSTPFLGTSTKSRELSTHIARLAKAEGTVLIFGEPGTGKSLVAQAIHSASPRSSGPFVACDLRKLDPSRVEAELSDALSRARGGTLFIEEVSGLPDAVAQALLSALEHGEHGAVGEKASASKSARVLLATSHDLEADGESGRSRPELLKHVESRVSVPSLRDRREDIPPLAKAIIKDFATAQGRPMPAISDAASTTLALHEWPGNVRELASVLQHAMSVDPKAETIANDHIRLDAPAVRQSEVRLTAPEWQTFKEAKEALLEAWEKDYLRRVLERSRGNMTLAARQAGIARGHLYRLMKKHGLCR